MSWDIIKGNWKSIIGKIKEEWGELTDDDLRQIDGKKDQLAGHLQRHYGYKADEVERKIDDFVQRFTKQDSRHP